MELRRFFFTNIPKRLIWNRPRLLTYLPAIRAIWPYTMLRYGGLCQVVDTVQEIDQTNVPGSIVEMGCWNGGCGALMAWASKRNGSNRPVWLFDSFRGLPELTRHDAGHAKQLGVAVASGDGPLKSSGVLVARKEHALAAARALNVDSHITICDGWFQETVPTVRERLGPIALLRLDGDTYESTKYCIETLYDLVAPGGSIIIDDYRNWLGCREALYEFFMNRGLYPYLQEYPFGVCYFKKS